MYCRFKNHKNSINSTLILYICITNILNINEFKIDRVNKKIKFLNFCMYHLIKKLSDVFISHSNYQM